VAASALTEKDRVICFVSRWRALAVAALFSFLVACAAPGRAQSFQ
jgi:hypothetical protein